MTLALPHLYTMPVDLYDYLGNDGAQLRVDDDNQATGLTITATANAVVGATALQCTAIQSYLMAGSQLIFRGSNQPSDVVVQLSAYAAPGTTTLPVTALALQVNNKAIAVDNGVNYTEAQRLVKGCRYGTSQVKLYCGQRYQDSDLYNNATENGSVNRWATIIGSKWLASRRSQGPSKELKEDFKDAMRELMFVKNGQLSIEDIPTRSAAYPFYSNMTVQQQYNTAKARFEPSISELTTTQYAQYIDWSSLWYIDF